MWIWSKLSGVQWQDAWEERFFGNPNAVITQIKGGKSVRVEVYTETEDDALEIKQQFGGSVRELKNQNWAALSEVKRPPVLVDNRIVIVGDAGDFESAGYAEEYPDRHVISIPADMAFGTGDHATTSNCLRHLVAIADEREGKDWEMLDQGTGSGVLAIAARMIGCKACFACDYDPLAVKVARGNLERNGTTGVDLVELDVLQWEPGRRWDVIMANVFCDVLQATFLNIEKALAPGGDVVISGILEDQWEPTRVAAEQAGLIFPDAKATGKWVTARGRRA